MWGGEGHGGGHLFLLEVVLSFLFHMFESIYTPTSEASGRNTGVTIWGLLSQLVGHQLLD